MRNEFWYFLACFLDTTPFLYLLYKPLRAHLRFSFGLTMAINHIVMLLGAVGFVWLHTSALYDLRSMLIYRLLWPFIMLALCLLLVKELWAKAVFVYSLVIPFITGILLVSAYISQFIKGDTPTYMTSSLIRLAITSLLYPLFILLWRELGRRSDKITDITFWRYLWIVPSAVACSEMLLIQNTYETQGVTLRDMLGRVVLWLGSVATCWLIFYLANHFEQRIHLIDAKERNDMLLSLQAEQYHKLADSIEETRAARHDLRHHLKAMKAMSEGGEYARLDAYLEDLLDQMPRTRQITVCENYTANIILDHFITRTSELGVPLKFSFHLSHTPGIADGDLCVLMGNALENALEAVMEAPADKRFILARALEEEDRIYLTFDNSFSGKLQPSGENSYLSRKRGFAAIGIGVTSIHAIVKKYGGDMRIRTEDGVFRMSILLYKKSNTAEEAAKQETATASAL